MWRFLRSVSLIQNLPLRAKLKKQLQARMNIEDLSLTIHAHPTLAEIVMDASELSLGLPIHI